MSKKQLVPRKATPETLTVKTAERNFLQEKQLLKQIIPGMQEK